MGVGFAVAALERIWPNGAWVTVFLFFAAVCAFLFDVHLEQGQLAVGQGRQSFAWHCRNAARRTRQHWRPLLVVAIAAVLCSVALRVFRPATIEEAKLNPSGAANGFELDCAPTTLPASGAVVLVKVRPGPYVRYDLAQPKTLPPETASLPVVGCTLVNMTAEASENFQVIGRVYRSEDMDRPKPDWQTRFVLQADRLETGRHRAGVFFMASDFKERVTVKFGAPTAGPRGQEARWPVDDNMPTGVEIPPAP